MEIKLVKMNKVDAILTPFTNYMIFYEREINQDEFRDYFASIIQDDRVFIYTAQVQDEIAGLMVIYQTYSSFECGKILFLNDLWVEPKFRKMGVGQAFMTKIKDLAKEENCKRIDLQTNITNKKARALYEKNGMITDAEFINYAVKL